jgi:hypothetical protein
MKDVNTIIEEILNLNRYDLENDGGCGDPECCGAPYYYIGPDTSGEYVTRSELHNKIAELKAALKGKI